MTASSTALYGGSHGPNDLLKCGNSYFHTQNISHSFWSVEFSKPVVVYSYTLFSNIGMNNALYNWDLYQWNSSNEWDLIDHKASYDTRNNTQKFVIQKPALSRSFKLVGGLDLEGDAYFLKFTKIEFYGSVSFESCPQSMHIYRTLFFYFILFVC